MQAAFPSGYGLAFIDGLDEIRVGNLVEQIRTTESPVYVSNINAPRQIVIAGSDAALAAVIAQALQHGARSCRATCGHRSVALPAAPVGRGSPGEGIRCVGSTALEVLRELGTNLFIEMAPGHLSTNLAAESIPRGRAISVADRGLRYAAVVAPRESRGS
jgi:malonate decarboxylase epsilon subunit